MTSLQTSDVCVGTDGWVFLIGGSNNALDFYSTNTTPFTGDICDAWRDLLLRRADRLASIGSRYFHLIAPEKLSVYPEYFPGDLDLAVRPASRILAKDCDPRLRSILIDPVNYFAKVKARNHKLYWKTDTHWTYVGCFAAYQLLMAVAGLPGNGDLLARPFHEGEIVLDLGGKLDPPVKELARFYRPLVHSRRISANPLVQFQEATSRFSEFELHMGTSVIYRNDSDSAIDAKVVLFGDSFSEYRPHLLTGMLAETFRETHFLWTSDIDYDYVARVGADIVVSESAERFMGRAPRDDVDFEAFVRSRLTRFGIPG